MSVKLKNLAVVAHVDHGKTTLVDELLKQAGVYDDRAEIVERVMDSGELEKERGITITAKNCSINWKDFFLITSQFIYVKKILFLHQLFPEW